MSVPLRVAAGNPIQATDNARNNIVDIGKITAMPATVEDLDRFATMDRVLGIRNSLIYTRIKLSKAKVSFLIKLAAF